MGGNLPKRIKYSEKYTVRTCLTSHLANIVLLHIWICLYTRCSLWATVLIEFCIRSVSHYKSQDLYRFWWKLNFPWDTHLKSELFTLKWVFIQNWTSVYTCSKVYTSDGATRFSWHWCALHSSVSSNRPSADYVRKSYFSKSKISTYIFYGRWFGYKHSSLNFSCIYLMLSLLGHAHFAFFKVLSYIHACWRPQCRQSAGVNLKKCIYDGSH